MGQGTSPPAQLEQAWRDCEASECARQSVLCFKNARASLVSISWDWAPGRATGRVAGRGQRLFSERLSYGLARWPYVDCTAGSAALKAD